MPGFAARWRETVQWITVEVLDRDARVVRLQEPLDAPRLPDPAADRSPGPRPPAPPPRPAS
jgi:hypothetical protein